LERALPGKRVLVIPTRIERQALLQAVPALMPLSDWAVPAWRTGELLVLECGMGPDRAAALLSHLERAAPEALWLVGWCGGLQDELRVGDVVLADATLSGAWANPLRIDHPPPQALVDWLGAWAARRGRRGVVAPVLTSPRVLERTAEKRAAGAGGAAAVEMEAAPLARWAAEQGVPFRHVRVVLDPLGSDLPPEELHGHNARGDESGGYTWRAVLRPRTWPALWRLLQQVRQARRVLIALGKALAGPGGPLEAER
jgi:nucleoside phosphorylase